MCPVGAPAGHGTVQAGLTIAWSRLDVDTVVLIVFPASFVRQVGAENCH